MFLAHTLHLSDIIFPLNGLLTKYIADAASYTAIGSGALYMVLMGANAAADANHTLTMEGRLTYSDY